MFFIYLFVCCMCIEWFVLLHDLYGFFARPIYQFIVATPRARCLGSSHNQAPDADLGRIENGQGKKKALGMNPKIVMEKLGMFWDPDDQRESIEMEDMVDIFVDDEPSLDEVKEAFCVFDKDNDGYIDAKELQNVLSGMGFLRISESDCGKMIVGYDADRDGKLSFGEFLNVVEEGFSLV